MDSHGAGNGEHGEEHGVHLPDPSAWPLVVGLAAFVLGAALIWRISSLAALIAIALSPLLFVLFHKDAYAALTLLLSVLIYVMHRENILRLLKGEEPRIGATKKSADAQATH